MGYPATGRTRAIALAASLLGAVASAMAGQAPSSPFDLAFSPDGKLLAVSDHTGAALAVIDVASAKVARRVPLGGQPTGVAWGSGGRVFVAEYGAGTVAEVDAAGGKILRRLAVGPMPVGVAVAAGRKLLLVANRGLNAVSVIDLASGKETKRLDTVRAPCFVAVAPDESVALVGNLLPHGPGTDSATAAVVSIMDLEKLQRIADIKLPGGSSSVRTVRVSPDGKWGYVVHTLGRVTLPTSQLDRGWVNTNALTVIDVAARQRYATVLLDVLTAGAANPWGVAVARDGKTLWASLAGVHQLARIDLAGLHPLLAGKADDALLKRQEISEVWREIKADAAKRSVLANDLGALYGARLIRRTDLPGNGPRGLDLSPDGKLLAVAAYFSGTVLLADPASGKTLKNIALAPAAKESPARRGERIFHDASFCFQGWLSCATCHPDGRVDGLNWDLLNDGMGNPKNAKSLVLSHKTPPVMSTGVRATMAVASASGFHFIQFRQVEPEALDAVQVYLRTLTPERSPHCVPDGSLSPLARRGKALFEDPKTGCAVCHTGELLTDLKSHDVGTRHELDRRDAFDNPTLIELWRTAPYLHDGSAPTLLDVLTTHNRGDKHGKTSHLSKDQLQALVAYLLLL